MHPSLSRPRAERALTWPDFTAWSETVSQPRNQHRLAFVVFIGLLTLVASTFEWSLLSNEGWSLLNLLLFVLFVPLFTHLAIGFAQAFFGFLLLTDRKKLRAAARPSLEELASLPVTAIVVPVYNEEVGPVFARIQVMLDSLDSLGATERFQFFVLSDSTDRAKALEEEVAWSRMVAKTGPDRVFYRRRKSPLNRKSGNIADFCRRWGSQYRYLICLDADSLMSGPTLLELVRRMEADHQIGILQTVPQAINGVTTWSRLQQFAMSLYGPIFAAGARFWQQEESNFWGHNAIIRLTPFIQHCALPPLPGKEITGERPMSHDFVEAALMRRAGWKVELAEELDGSYEETPPTVIEHLKRDRRWCQGNLQHWSFVFARGFKPATRFHFLHGIFSFLASPLLVIVLFLGFAKNLKGTPINLELIDPLRGEIALLLFGFTMLLLVLPKFLALGLALHRKRAPEFGGAPKIICSAIAEIFTSILIAPVFLVFHARFVLCHLLGKQVQWHAQQRGSDTGPGWSAVAQIFGSTTALGICAGAITWFFTAAYFWWLLPILLGWMFAIPLAFFLGHPHFGQWLQKRRLFSVPSEIIPEKEVRQLRQTLRTRSHADRSGWSTILHPALVRHAPSLPDEVRELHRKIWSSPAPDLPVEWRRELAALELRAD